MADNSQEHPALKLARYLGKYVGLKSKVVRDIQKYNKVLWFGDMPQDQDCQSGAWSDDYEEGQPLLEVRKQKFDKCPDPPKSIVHWVDSEALRQATLEMPPLRTVIYESGDDSELEEGETPPLVEHLLIDHPEVREAYDLYCPKWEAWSNDHQRRTKIQGVYSDLFHLHTQVKNQGEVFELVLGLGLLDWQPKIGDRELLPITRHTVSARIELKFDAERGVIRVLPSGEGIQLQIEDDMLEMGIRPGRSEHEMFEDVLAEIEDGLWDRVQLHKALNTWAGQISPDSEWSPELDRQPRNGNSPTISFAPALILRKRNQAGTVRIYEQIIEQLSADSSDVPCCWNRLVNYIKDESSDFDVDNNNSNVLLESKSTEPSEIYFPLTSNREQRRIVTAMEHHTGVLVQGPPGTGKSQTIANLMCHLLASGKRVLITAENGRALRVLNKMLPPEIRPLCISLLGQGGDSFAELNKAVQAITTKLANHSPGRAADKIVQIDEDLESVRQEMAATDSIIRSLREDETNKCSVANGTYLGTPSKIAKRVFQEKDQYNWLKLPNDSDSQSPISSMEVLSWLKIRRRYSDRDISDSILKVPSSGDLLSPEEFSMAVEGEKVAKDALELKSEIRAHEAYGPIRALFADSRDKFRNDLLGLEEQRIALGPIEEGWREVAVRDALSGSRRVYWAALADVSLEKIAKIKPLIKRVGDQSVTVPKTQDAKKIQTDSKAVIAHLEAGGKWKKFGFFTPKELKGRVYLNSEVLVDGVGASDIEKLQTVVDYLDIDIALSELLSAWDHVGAPLPADNQKMCLAVLQEQVEVIGNLIKYVDTCHELAELLAASSPPIPQPNWIDGDPATWLKLMEVSAVEDQFHKAAHNIDSRLGKLNNIRDLHDVHPSVSKLIGAIITRSVHDYSLGHAQVVSIERTLSDQKKRAKIESSLSEVTPGFVECVVSTLNDTEWDDRFKSWEEAWCWAIADVWLEARSDLNYQRKLLEKRSELEKKIRALLGNAVSERAWMFFVERLTPEKREALNGWREAVRAIGKGTGRSARVASLRRQARAYMKECRDAIPIWIMPRYLVPEYCDTEPGYFDLVIADEASQLGIESMFLFYMAKNIVVVGDDQQISPAGVGVKQDEVSGLQAHYLEGIPHQHALSEKSSLYANAKIRFSQNIVLREHFRCMPEIIQFSNDLCYANNGTPLDPLRPYASNRLVPIVRHYVEKGYNKGGPLTTTNPPEAEAIVAQIAACVDDPRYAGLSMGVISLKGRHQAKLIERKLEENLDLAIIEERRLFCGDSYVFQGDERDVIFLSMVSATCDELGEKNKIGCLANDAARQRFNVATSRAKDQLWLFHSAQLEDLSPACMRHELLGYMLNPVRKVTVEAEQFIPEGLQREVYRKIIDRGYHVECEVEQGDSTNHRYRIDLVVQGMKGSLAVECDGDQWHGPERYEADMARQRDLERAGWQFVRIRGGDYYRNREEAMKPLWAELERLGIEPGGIDKTGSQPPAPLLIEASTPVDGTSGEIEECQLPTEREGGVPSTGSSGTNMVSEVPLHGPIVS